MATILIRARYNEVSQRNMQTPGWSEERQRVSSELCEKAGCKLIGLFMSLTTGEAVVMIEGEIDQASLIQALYQRTGAFTAVSVEILNSAQTLNKYLVRAGELQSQFVAPNEDEIDRMLLDE